VARTRQCFAVSMLAAWLFYTRQKRLRCVMNPRLRALAGEGDELDANLVRKTQQTQPKRQLVLGTIYFTQVDMYQNRRTTNR
jgi:hypothetical protein